MAKRIGLYGGSFNPVHNGHLAVAETALKRAALDCIYFIPAKNQPFKGVPSAPGEDRLAMLRLALEGKNAFLISSFELEKPGVSYSIETVACFKEQFPEATLYFIMGEDSYFTLPRWKESEKLLTLMTPLVVTREGEQRRNITPPAMYIDMPPVAVSSSMLRKKIFDGESVEDALPPAVLQYIQEKGLYRP